MMIGPITQNVETEHLLFTMLPIINKPNQHTDSLLIVMMMLMVVILINTNKLVYLSIPLKDNGTISTSDILKT